MKINKKLLIISAILTMLIIVIVVSVFARKSVSLIDSGKSSVNISTTGIIAQSYAAEKLPTWQDGDKIFGSSNAPLKIFVYEDYASIYSANLADTLYKISTEYGNQVAVIVRPYSKGSSFTFLAAAAVDCAGAQGKWQEMRSLIFSGVKNGKFMAADSNTEAQQIGLNVDSYKACLTKVQKSGKIEQTTKDEIATIIQGAPTMFVGEEMILGARPYDNYVDSNGDKIEGLKQVVERKLSVK
ncbi:MAG: thioredoxin domain-containing protein [Patescibacteria group bacterium]|jgi:protein-disulfide isomerase